MTTQLQFRRGNTTQTSTFTGAMAEVTVNTDNYTLVVHDGSTPGGHYIATQDFAQAAFNAANSAGSSENVIAAFNKANSAYESQNTTGIYANTALEFANSASSYANSAFDKVNSVYQYANTLSPEDNVARGTANSAALYANGAFLEANASFGTANSAATYANSAFLKANAAYESQNTTGTYANSAFGVANNAVPKAGGTMTGDLLMTANIIPTTSNTYYLGSVDKVWHSIYVGPGSINIDGVVLGNTGGSLSITNPNGSTLDLTQISNTANSAGAYANAAFNYANSAYAQANGASVYANGAFVQANAAYQSQNTTGDYANSAFGTANSAAQYANAAFATANTKFNSSGGTISGDTNITGNLTVTGTTFYANTVNLLVEDNIITLNSNVTGTPTQDSGIEVNRGNQTNTSLLWSESKKSWQFTNDGTNYSNIASSSAETYANGSFVQANASFGKANSAGLYANAAFAQANAAFESANNVAPQVAPAFGTANSAALYANGAFVQANASYGQANSAGSYANSAFLAANTADAKAVTAGSYANSAFSTANTAVSNAAGASLYANGAFTQANAAFTAANTADAKAVTAGSYANSAFTAANTADSKAVSAGSYANGAFVQANASYDKANTATTNAATADSKAVTAGSYANSAFGTANSAALYANGAFVQANSAFASANSKATVYSQDTSPTSPSVDDIWIDSSSGIEYKYISSNSASQWIEFGPVGTPLNGTAGLGFSDQTMYGVDAGTDITIQQIGQGNIVLQSANTIITGNLIANATGKKAEFNNLSVVYFRVNTATTIANSAAINIVASTGYYVQPPTADGYVLQATGKDGVPTRMVIDSAGGDGTVYSAFIGRKARGTHQNPTAAQNGDLLARFSGNGYGATGYGVNAGGGSMDIYALENYTDTARGSSIVLSATPIGTNTRTQIATFTSNTVTMTGQVYAQKGFSSTPRTVVNETPIVIDFSNDSVIRAQINAATTFSFTNYYTGKQVDVWVTNTTGSAKTVTHGCTSTNSTNNSATQSIPGTSSILMRYICFDGDSANVLVAIIQG
jgi:hypothetical protein